MKFPLVIVYMIIAFNLTVFTVMLQLDWLIYHSVILKVICWTLTIGAWALAYFKRHTFIKLF